MKDKIIEKILSGRYLLTVLSGAAFIYLTVTKQIDTAQAMTIIAMVFTLYFSRNDRKGE